MLDFLLNQTDKMVERKPNNNLNSFINKGYAKKAAFKAENDSKIIKYGKKSYVNKLIDLFKSDNTSTSDYWVEVSE